MTEVSVKVALLRAYGAKVVEVTAPDPQTSEFRQARINRVRELLRERSGAVWANQYANPDNALAHQTPCREIVEALDGRLDPACG